MSFLQEIGIVKKQHFGYTIPLVLLSNLVGLRKDFYIVRLLKRYLKKLVWYLHRMALPFNHHWVIRRSSSFRRMTTSFYHGTVLSAVPRRPFRWAPPPSFRSFFGVFQKKQKRLSPSCRFFLSKLLCALRNDWMLPESTSGKTMVNPRRLTCPSILCRFRTKTYITAMIFSL